MINNKKWKKNYHKNPEFIKNRIKEKKLDKVIVGCVKKISLDDIKLGKYKHLKIKYENNEVLFPKNIIPDPKNGKYSTINIYGKEIIRKDLPKISKTYTWEAPDYGDWSRGSHDVSIDREVYQRDFISPKELDIKIALLEKNLEEGNYIFKFVVNEVIDVNKNYDTNEDLLYNLNLLQENIGIVDVYSANADDAEYLQTIYVDWEILPIGTKDIMERILSGLRVEDETIRKKYISRYNIFKKLKPIVFIKGTNSFRRYFGAKFSDNLVAFENLEYGNAIYVMNEKWESLSRLSRIELLKMKDKNFVRIIHKSGWEEILKRLIMENLNN